ncbi:MAG: hypothetical protein DI534_07970 [Leifsonia xyli]|nr:MAG: hypothetical protein DI534_07970 [Leifsonia xyli]
MFVEGTQSTREILLIVEAEIATVQLITQVLSHLERDGELSWRMRSVAEVTADDLGADTFPLIVRSCNHAAFLLSTRLRASGIPFGFYLDDNFWAIEPTTELGRYYAAPRTRRQLEAIVRGADIVIAATDPLREYLMRYTSRVVQLDSFYDFGLASAQLDPPPKRATIRGGFAASLHRGDDLSQILPAVLAALERHDHLEFEVIGAEIPGLPEDARIRCFPYQESYVDYTRFQLSRQWDFGLAPLGPAASNRYKTDNKYREYAALGIAGIYQDAPPYAKVEDGVTGVLAGGERSWDEAIGLLVGDGALRQSIRDHARRDAEERVSLAAVAPRWGAVLRSAPTIGERTERLERFRALGRAHLVPRMRERFAVLVRLAGAEYATNGLMSTVRRTGRFLLASLRGRRR